VPNRTLEGIPAPHTGTPARGGGSGYTVVMEQAITAALPPDDLAALDRVCRDQGVSRLDAVESAVRWYIERDGDLPSVAEIDDEIEL
jgi:hypothetical protein